jgi:hypothetical protein
MRTPQKRNWGMMIRRRSIRPMKGLEEGAMKAPNWPIEFPTKLTAKKMEKKSKNVYDKPKGWINMM